MSDLETRKETAMTTGDMNAWGNTKISARDMVIPKILPLQYMSDKVKNKEGEYGEFRDTLSNNLFGDMQNPFEVIPFLMHKKWLEFDLIPKKNGGFDREYSQTVMIQDNPLKPGFNDDLPLQDLEKNIERDRVMDFFVLIPSEVEKGEDTPYVLSFRRTSLKAGQKMATQQYVRNAAAGKNPAATVMMLSGKDKENDKGSFVVQDVVPSRASTEKEMAAAFKWFNIINQGNVKVDESDLVGPERVVSEDMGEF